MARRFSSSSGDANAGPPSSESGVASGGDGGRQSDDVGDLHKGALANLAGHAARFAQPLLLLFAARLYGASDWGIFVAGQAAYQLLSKASLLGLDRGLVFWVPRAIRTGTSLALRPSAIRVGLASIAIATLAGLAAPVLADGKGISPSTWLLMALGVLPLSLTDLLIYATVGKRRMDIQVVVRDVLVPLSTLVLAIGLHLAGAGGWGLGLAFAIGHCLGLGASLRASGKIFGRDAFRDRSPMPDELRRFALPQWGSELALALLYRLDAIVLAIFAPPAVVGIYGVALQFGNTVRSLRGAFDPLVSAVASDIDAEGKSERLDEAMAYALRVVVLLQAPVVALFVFLGVPLLALFGPGFETGYVAVVVLSVGWALHGLVGLASPVLAGFGQSRLLLASTIFGLVIEAALLFVTVPLLGQLGAALSLVCAFLAQAALQVFMLRRLLGRLPAARSVGSPLKVVAFASACGVAAGFVGALIHEGAGPFVGFAGFALSYLPVVLPALRPSPRAT